MRDFLIGYTTLTSNWQESIVGQAEPEQKLLGDLETKGYVEVDAKTGNIVLSKKGQDYNAQATNPADKINPQDYALDADKNIHHIAYNDFLESVSRYTNGAAADRRVWVTSVVLLRLLQLLPSLPLMTLLFRSLRYWPAGCYYDYC